MFLSIDHRLTLSFWNQLHEMVFTLSWDRLKIQAISYDRQKGHNHILFSKLVMMLVKKCLLFDNVFSTECSLYYRYSNPLCELLLFD